MIPVEELDALDLLIWLGRGSDAADRLGCNQSTVSRRSKHCLQVFDLRLHRNRDGDPCTRSHDLLHLERQVHQLHRLRRNCNLRLDASLLAAPLLQGALPDGWMVGHLDELGWQRPLQLLQERILDAWITGMGQELRPGVLNGLCCLPLLSTPLLLASQPDHPLQGQGQLRHSDLEGMPRLAPRPGSYPRTEVLLGSWRQGNPPLQLETGARRRLPDAELLLERSPLLLHYGTAFSLARQSTLRRLPLELGVQTQLSLVIRRDLLDQAALVQLIDTLQQRALAAALADQGVLGLN